MPELSTAVQTQLNEAVSRAVAEESGMKPLLGLPAPTFNLGDAKESALNVVTEVEKALEVLLKFSFLIPAQYQTPLQGLANAVKTVKGWLD